MRLAEMRKDRLPAAGGGLADGEQRIELGALDPLDLVGSVAFVDHPAALDDIGHAIGHPDIGRQAVTAGTAGLLIIGLDRARQIEMGDIAHVRLVDAHAEGDGGDQAEIFLFQEGILIGVAKRAVHAGMIGAARRMPCPFSHSAVSSTLARDRQ
jgi:hypothetical protein